LAGDFLSVTNVQASFYKGQLTWAGEFDFGAPIGQTSGFAARSKTLIFVCSWRI